MIFGAIVVTVKDGNGPRKKISQDELTFPSSTSFVLGRFATITSLEHDNLCKYIEVIRCQTVPNGLILVSEFLPNLFIRHDAFLNNRIGTPDLSTSFSVACQICSAMEFCHSNNVAIGSLSLNNIVVQPDHFLRPHIKLSLYGLGYICGGTPPSNSLSFPAPETILDAQPDNETECLWTDIWAFGIVLIEVFSGWRLAEIWSRKQILSVLSSLICKSKTSSIYEDLLDTLSNTCPAFGKSMIYLQSSVGGIVKECLNILPSQRPPAAKLLLNLRQLKSNEIIPLNASVSEPNLSPPLFEQINEIKNRIEKENRFERLGFSKSTLYNAFFLWKLCGSSVENILVRKGVITVQPPVSTLPSLLVDNFNIYGFEKEAKFCASNSLTKLPMNNLYERLDSYPRDQLFLSFELREALHLAPSHILHSSGNQSLVIREKDIIYQFHRMHLFRRLLAAWPNKAEIFRAECQLDIPPVYRGSVWAALLGVFPPCDLRDDIFYKIDTFSEHLSDRQLQVDIPRCHQYDELMASPVAHHKMKLLLKALLICRKDEYVYWQGLDSLCAPFLILNFNHLPTAFHCLNAFIDRYLRGFFVKDNTTVIRNYLAEFMRVLEFCDSELFLHLISLDFQPELFAIPWFLTCFAHVLPLHKIFHLWDSLLLSDDQFPLFIGVAILFQLRSRLIDANFNEAILLFSDLPDLPIDEVVLSAKTFYRKWKSTNNL